MGDNRRESPPVVCVPRFCRGSGTGHIVRSLRLARRARDEGRRVLIAVDEGQLVNARKLAFLHGVDPSLLFSLEDFPRHPMLCGEESPAPLIVADLRASSAKEVAFLDSLGYLVGIDEGGDFRQKFSYLIDLLPKRKQGGKANIGILPSVGEAETKRSSDLPSVLISFGGEDPENLTPLIVRLLIDGAYLQASQIQVIRRSVGEPFALPAGVKQIDPVPDPLPLFRSSDLLISSFGLTAWEAVSCGTAVLLLNPSRYHQLLSKQSGFSSLGWVSGRKGRDRLEIRLRHLFPERPLTRLEISRLHVPNPGDGWNCDRDVESLILSMRPEGGVVCPLCGRRLNSVESSVVHRSEERSVRRCASCGAMALFDPFPPENRYGEDYFFSEYRSQYGRDYLEDFDHIKALSVQRLEHIAAVIGKTSGRRLLDIGCAYGPFLAAARDAGFFCEGIEITPGAVSYVKERLDIPVYAGAVDDILFDGPLAATAAHYDVITLWYVVEHLPNLFQVIEGIQRLLRPGGVFAFSTPSFRGMSARRKPDAFFAASPSDHLSIMAPEQVSSWLSRHGFRVDRLVSTGIHSERFPFPFSAFPESLLHSLAARLRLGDTFELYATKQERYHDRPE
ncbi:methyltransferase domain-containing protein [Sediminispirochaeta smaragdinae]|uniref:Methyltransferase type 12 n=1 Tax=Sediminispirochaeta smaragdinae (strain DSM 11293 / JCM 15392 / SEBR 4228) TaxID=573413 RepID=E1R3R2_SEDSS|nr:methyltransferase domain-containing protein [Sediminispirochaeta smaragdinae]ADK82033.1 Methyltransferase type 12 [Sediminispirochaeta smaragdinae DSM 11293]